MGISLEKGGRISLSKEAPGLKKLKVGLGWDVNKSDTGADFDLDVSVFLLDANDKVPADEYFIFYNNPKSPCGAVVHSGDNRTGEGEGDDEVIQIELDKIDPKIEKIVFVVTIYDAENRNQNFGQVNNAYIRLVNDETNEEIAKYELDEDFSTETAVNFGELYKKNNEWRFKAVGAGYKKGLDAFAKEFGVNV